MNVAAIEVFPTGLPSFVPRGSFIPPVGCTATTFGKNGGNLSSRFPTISTAVLALSVRSCLIDGELIAAGEHGEPDFLALLRGRNVPVCAAAAG
jgi:hypothetical protein